MRVLEAFGRNPLFVFVVSGFVPRVLGLLRWADGYNADGTVHWTTPLPWVYQTVFANLGSDPRLGSLLFAAANLSAYGLLAAWLDRRQIYIRV
jgi:predicted acyltransferase